MRALRWIGRIVAGLVGFVVLAVVGVVLFMHTHFGRELVRKQVESKLAATFVGGATVGSVHGTPFTDIVVSDLVINGPDRKPAITIGELHLHADLLSLVSHELVLTKLVASDVDVMLKRDDQGELAVKHLTKPGPPSSWSVRLPEVEIHRAHVQLDTGGEPVDLDGIELGAHVALPHGGPIDVGAAVSATWRQRRAPIGVAATLHVDAERITVPMLMAAVSDASVAAAGVDVPKAGGAASGDVAVHARASTVAALAHGIELPGDVALEVSARRDGEQTLIALAGALDRSPLHGALRADLGAKTIAGFVGGARFDLAALSRGKIEGTGNAFAVFDAAPPGDGEELPRAHAIVQTWGDVGDLPATAALIAIDTSGDRVRAVLGFAEAAKPSSSMTRGGAANAEGLHAAIGADVRRHGNALTLMRGELVATTPDPARASGGKAPVHGSLDAQLAASGELTPAPDLSISGHVDGARLRVKDLAARTLRLRIAAAHAPSHPIGTARLELADVERGDLQLRRLTLAAGNRPDGKIQVSLRTEPKPAPWLVELDALVTIGQRCSEATMTCTEQQGGKAVAIDVQRHFVRARGGSTWHGSTGHIVIGPEKIEVRDLRSASDDGRLAVDASYIRAGRRAGEISAKLDASLGLDKILGAPPLSHVDAKIAIDPGRVTAAIDAATPHAGEAKIALDVAAPAKIADARAWKSLPRTAIRNGKITLRGIDLGELAKRAGMSQDQALTGQLDGDIELTPQRIGGVIQARGVNGQKLRDIGPIDADVRIDQTAHDELTATASGRVQQVGQVEVQASVETPDRMFDPLAWKRLGIGALRGASARSDEIAFEPGTLEKLGIVSQFRGKIALAAQLEAGARAANVTIDLRDLHGGVITMPVAAHVEARADARATHAKLSISASGAGSAGRLAILDGEAHVPLSLTELRTNPKAARTAPLEGRIELPHIAIRQLLAVLGNTQVTGGTLDGRITVGGTVGRPTAVADLVARDVTVPPGSVTVPVQAIRQVKIAAKWNGEAGSIDVTGDETDGGKLHIFAGGRPDAPKEIAGTLEASKLDLAPLVAFMPGPAGGVAGRLDGKLDVRGIDPKTSQIGGQLRITEGRLPIAPQVGTLFHGDVSVKVENHLVNVNAAGKLGAGDITLVGSAPLDGAAPTGAQVRLTMRKVQLIGTTEPILDGIVVAQLTRKPDRWTAQVDVSKAFVRVPDEKGEKLRPVGAPPDLVYGGPARHTPPRQVEGPDVHRRPPQHPVFVANVTLHDTKIEAKEVRGNVSGKLRVLVGGKEVGVVGNVGLDRGDLDLFDRRYNIERAALHFDGSIDPELDVRITHDFPDVTTVTEVHGRLSKPQLQMSSEPATYSQSELLGFLLGGEPGGDPNMAPSARERVESAGASFVANKIGGYVKQALPVDIDVLRYETANANSSAAVTVGTWITHDLFLAYRRHLETRPDENAGEGEIEYWLQRRVSLTGTVGDRGYDGVDLLWRRRW